MVWLFHRNHEVIRVETRFDNAVNAYLLRVVRSDGSESVERFTDADVFETRTQALERELVEARYVQRGGPRFDPDGWRV